MKRSLLSTAFAIITLVTFAQDMIVKKDGSIIQAKVSEIGTSEVKYKKWSNQDGPLYTIAKNDILAITYQNGEKETFEAVTTPSAEIEFSSQEAYLESDPDENNQGYIDFYNKTYEWKNGNNQTNKPAATAIAVFKAKTNSIFSNKDIEMWFEVCPIEYYLGHRLFCYQIAVKNKTDKTIYIDNTQSYRTTSLGDSVCFYNDEAKYNPSVKYSKSIAIAPFSTITLGDFLNQKGEVQKNTETFSFNYRCKFSYVPYYYEVLGYIGDKSITTKLRLTKGDVSVGELKNFDDNDSPLNIAYSIAYSKDESCRIISRLNVYLYLSQLFGKETKYVPAEPKNIDSYVNTYESGWMSGSGNTFTNLIKGWSERTILGAVGLINEVDIDKLQQSIDKADAHFSNREYKKANRLYVQALSKGYPATGTLYFKAGVSAYNSGNSYASLASKYLSACYDNVELDTMARSNISGLVKNARERYGLWMERKEGLAQAIETSLPNIISGISENIKNSSNSGSTIGKVKTSNPTKISQNQNVDDNDDDEPEDTSLPKVKCHECGGSGKCKLTGIGSMPLHCNGSGKCPRCNGSGRTHNKCPKCKGEGCSKCDETGYTECTSCDGSGECDHCGGSGKCPRCGGTGKE